MTCGGPIVFSGCEKALARRLRLRALRHRARECQSRTRLRPAVDPVGARTARGPRRPDASEDGEQYVVDDLASARARYRGSGRRPRPPCRASRGASPGHRGPCSPGSRHRTRHPSRRAARPPRGRSRRRGGRPGSARWTTPTRRSRHRGSPSTRCGRRREDGAERLRLQDVERRVPVAVLNQRAVRVAALSPPGLHRDDGALRRR